MPAAYDKFDYPSYWKGRDYEHKSEIHAISEFLESIKKIKTVVEIGGGFGRLVQTYAFRAKKTIITDPSSQLLKIAKDSTSNIKNISFIHSKAENLKGKIKTNTIDLVLMVRVLHHIRKPEKVFSEISRILKSGGYFILEYPNKAHFKANFRELMKGDITYSMDIFKVDKTSKRNKKKGSLPFYNYHPDNISDLLKSHDFEVISRRSVSNIRSTFLKRIFSVEFLFGLEKLLQIPFSYLNFGPSMFVLVRKKADYE